VRTSWNFGVTYDIPVYVCTTIGSRSWNFFFCCSNSFSSRLLPLSAGRLQIQQPFHSNVPRLRIPSMRAELTERFDLCSLPNINDNLPQNGSPSLSQKFPPDNTLPSANMFVADHSGRVVRGVKCLPGTLESWIRILLKAWMFSTFILCLCCSV
jgi:hypothetical protein